MVMGGLALFGAAWRARRAVDNECWQTLQDWDSLLGGCAAGALIVGAGVGSVVAGGGDYGACVAERICGATA